MKNLDLQSQKTGPLRPTPEILSKGNKNLVMNSFPRKTTLRPSPYSGRFPVLTMGSTSLLCMVKDRRLGATFRAGKQNLRRMHHRDIHPLFRHILRDRIDAPGGRNPQQILIQLRVSHHPSLLQKLYQGDR